MGTVHKFKMMLGLCMIVSMLSGCASYSYGTKVDRDKVSQIEKGVTTRAEVENLLGPPENVAMYGEGRRLLWYSYYEQETHATPSSFIPYVGLFAGGAEGQSRRQMLQIMLNKKDVVEDYEFTDSTGRIEHSGGVFGREISVTPAKE